LTINGEKMAKSLGNFISIKDFLARYRDPDYLKFLFLSTHYRHPVDYSDAKIGEMKKEKERFLILIGEIDRILKAGSKGRSSSEGKAGEIEPFRRKFEEAMDDDFNTPLALAALFDLATYANKFLHGEGATDQDTARKAAAVKSLLLEAGGVLGLDLAQAASQEEMDVKKVKRLIKERDEARERRDFKAADRIRQELSAKGIILEDTKEGTIWRERV
jgi:cysteinyl-tRNA synthetase